MIGGIMNGVGLRRAGFACAAFLMAQTAGTLAADEVLMRQSMSFHQCPSAVEGILASMNASDDAVIVTRDTGAHYTVKLQAVEANLVFVCNAVTAQIEILRQTPGDLSSGDRTASAD